MSGWDEGRIFVPDQAVSSSFNDNYFGFQTRFEQFIKNFREKNSYIYRLIFFLK